MNNIKDLVLTALTDEELAAIVSIVDIEQDRRMKVKSHPVLICDEKELVLGNKRLDAIKAYKSRNKCSVRQAIFVVNKYQDEVASYSPYSSV